MRTLVLVVLVSSVAGCDDSIECTAEARGSVQVTITDAAGEPVPEATARYTVDGGESTACDEMPDGIFVCGWEVAGDFVVTAEAPGYEPTTGSVTVGADECHVISESLPLVLADP